MHLLWCRSIRVFCITHTYTHQKKNGPHQKLKLGQVLAIQMDYEITLGNLDLRTLRATIHSYFGEILYQENILVTFIYEK